MCQRWLSADRSSEKDLVSKSECADDHYEDPVIDDHLAPLFLGRQFEEENDCDDDDPENDAGHDAMVVV